MTPKETPKIRKSKTTSQTAEDKKKIIDVDVGVIGDHSVASEFSKNEIDGF